MPSNIGDLNANDPTVQLSDAHSVVDMQCVRGVHRAKVHFHSDQYDDSW